MCFVKINCCILFEGGTSLVTDRSRTSMEVMVTSSNTPMRMENSESVDSRVFENLVLTER